MNEPLHKSKYNPNNAQSVGVKRFWKEVDLEKYIDVDELDSYKMY